MQWVFSSIFLLVSVNSFAINYLNPSQKLQDCIEHKSDYWHLLVEMKSPDVSTRLTAACAIANLREKRSFGPLAFALKYDSSPIVREMAALGLEALGDARSVPYFLDALFDAGRLSGKVLLSLSETEPKYTYALSDFAYVLGWGIGQMGGRQITRKLIQGLSSQTWEVRWGSVKALEMYTLRSENSPEWVEEVLGELIKRVRTDLNCNVYWLSLEALGNLRDSRALEPLREILMNKIIPPSVEWSQSREDDVLAVLAQYHDSSVVPLIKEWYEQVYLQKAAKDGHSQATINLMCKALRAASLQDLPFVCEY